MGTSDKLDETILKLYKDILKRDKQSLNDKVKIGSLLQEKKKQVGYGNWMKYCEKHYHSNGLSQTTIDRYMKMSRLSTNPEKKHLFDGSKTTEEVYRAPE